MFDKLLANKSLEQVSFGAYLACRVLRHRHSERTIDEMLQVGSEGNGPSNSDMALARQMIHEIERREKAPVQRISGTQTSFYIRELMRLVRSSAQAELQYDKELERRALNGLRAEPRYKSGDVVRLKSGGPAMTVQGYDERDWVVCAWFERDVLKTGLFIGDALERTGTELETAGQGVGHSRRTRPKKKGPGTRERSK